MLAAGTPARVLAEPAVCRAYLGDAPAMQPGFAAA
ncbi:hypothetical protein [Burkholderia ubonensis]